jgi:4-amino-4-deoxy-L-arabinose transferase-like glycosyltransferase
MLVIKKFSRVVALSAVALICIASFSLMLWASRSDSAIMDELAHVPAGYGYVHELDYRLNPEHPPLIKALAMAPVLFLNPVYPMQTAAWQTEVNAQWDMGYQFLYNSGNDATAIIRTARIMPILVTILLIILMYVVAQWMIGDLWALLPTFLLAFDPNVLAHGHYVTTDVGAAFGFLFAIYFFLKFTEQRSTKYLWYAGLAFGVAQITKFSTPLLVPLFIFLALVLWWRDLAREWRFTDSSRRAKTALAQLWKWVWQIAVIFAIGYAVVVYPVYTLFTAHYPTARQVSDTATILTSFATGPTSPGHFCQPMRCLADADIWMASHRLTQPVAQYTLGVLMVLQRSDASNTIYFLGHVVESGGWIYFPVLYLLKEPIPTLIIVLFGLLLGLWWIARESLFRTVVSAQQVQKRDHRAISSLRDVLDDHFREFAFVSLIVLYWGYSMHSPLNIGIRHLMPTLPFIFLLAAVVWKSWITKLNLAGVGNVFDRVSMLDSLASAARSFAVAIIKYIFLVLLLCWLVLETLFAAPYFLSYFNEFAGGVWGGYHYVTDSNYDWGQDMLRLQSFVNAHPEIDKIAVDYFGGSNPKYYLGDKEVDWSSIKGNPTAQGIHWLAVSVNTLELATQPLAPGNERNASDTYSWLTALRPAAAGGIGNVPPPDFRAGTSIFIYHLQ